MEIKVLEFLKGLGTIVLYLVLSIMLSYFFSDLAYHDNVVIATIFQILS